MSREIAKRIWAYVKTYRGYLFAALGSAVLYVAAMLFVPVLIGDGVDRIVAPGAVDFAGLVPILLALAGTIAVSSLFQWLMTLCTNKVTHRTVRDLRRDAFQKLSALPLRYLDGNRQGDVMARLTTDTEQISDGLLQGFAQLFTGVVTILGTILFMLSVHVWITLLVVVLTPLSLFVASFIAKRTYDQFRKLSAVRGELSGLAEEMLGNGQVIRAFGRQSRAQARFEEINARLYDVGVPAQFYASLTNPCTRFVNSMVYAAVGMAGAITAIYGGLTVGGISCFLSYANQYTKPFNEISGVVTELQAAFASAKRVFDLMDAAEESPDPPDALAPTHCRGEVRLKEVSFSYHKGQSLIEGLTLYAHSGERIAIVGPTGCGKTTLINLLMRFYDVRAGSISVDGTDIRRIRRDALRAAYGMVLQDTWLFSGTVRENIAYGAPDATEEQIVEAARAAHAHSFIKRLPNGYDTVIGEDGDSLSQGQRQLLCIARVMLTNPPMLILDEATSSIDTRTEIRVQRAFDRMMQGKTSFVVAHRLSTIRQADLILVMRDGKVVEQGTHDALLRENGFYARLYRSQFEAVERQI